MLCKQLQIQCKCYVNSCLCKANSRFAFWNFLDFFPYIWPAVGWIHGCRSCRQRANFSLLSLLLSLTEWAGHSLTKKKKKKKMQLVSSTHEVSTERPHRSCASVNSPLYKRGRRIYLTGLLFSFFVLGFYFLYYSWFILFCQFLLYTHTHIYIYAHTFFSHIILHHVPPQGTRYSSLCYTAGSHCLSIPNAIFASTNPNSQSIPLPSPPLWQPQFYSPSPWVCFFSVERGPSYNVGRNVNLYNHHGKQHGGTLENSI